MCHNFNTISDECDLFSKYLIEIYKNTCKDDTVSSLICKIDYFNEPRVNKCEYISIFQTFDIFLKQLSCIMINMMKHQIKSKEKHCSSIKIEIVHHF